MKTQTPSLSKKKTKKSKAIPKDIRQRCLTSFQKLRRLEEANSSGFVQCISCGKVMHWKESQGGHYISRGCMATEIDPDNVWPQCPQCNGPLNGNLHMYRLNLVRKIGEERVLRLEHMFGTWRGSDEYDLSISDSVEVIRKKGKVYYSEKKKEFDQRIKELE